MKCGLCGSGVSAEEKYKKLKNGSVNKYIYYGCTRAKDNNCKCGYMREESVIAQLVKIIDKIDINEIGLKKQFEEEIKRYNKFQKTVLLMNGKGGEIQKNKQFDIKAYSKYLLKEGTITEKRELLASLKSRLIFQKKKITLEKSF